MCPLQFPVSVVIECVPLANRWASELWRVATVERDENRPARAVKLADDGAGTRWRFVGHAIELHRSESEGYFLNITAPEPKVFVMWRMIDSDELTVGGPDARPHLVTVSYNEAARLLDGGERIDVVPLPPEILAWMQPFVAEHYRPEPKRKVRRNELYERDAKARDAPPRNSR
jgi:hypothetical protein